MPWVADYPVNIRGMVSILEVSYAFFNKFAIIADYPVPELPVRKTWFFFAKSISIK